MRGPDAIAAGVSVFRPDAALLLDLVERLAAGGASPILLHVDGPAGTAIEPALLERLAGDARVTLLRSPENVGLGAGLNRLCDEARRRDAAAILLFDQDSTPDPGLGRALAARLRRLREAGARPAVVGPRPVAPPNAESKAPRYPKRASPHAVPDTVPVAFVITSGSLVDLEGFAAVGPFRADYWIDGIDTEWCFRAWDGGFSVWLAEDLTMTHRIGSGILRLGPVSFPRQSAGRMASYVRNQAYGLRLSHLPLGFRLRQMLYLPVQAAVYLAAVPHRRRTASLLLRALRDGLGGRLGRPDDAGKGKP